MPESARDQLVVALDVGGLDDATALVDRLGDHVLWFKVGLELYVAAGPEAVRRLTARGKRVFLDLKLHDIPNTVARSAAMAADLGVDVLDLHVAAGSEAMRAAVAAVTEVCGRAARPRILGVTVLTSAASLEPGGGGLAHEELIDAVAARAALAQEAGLDGVVCPAPAMAAVRTRCGDGFDLLVPGIRPAGSARADQRWVATPEEAVSAGARWIVVGRPITGAQDPRAAAAAILAQMAGGA